MTNEGGGRSLQCRVVVGRNVGFVHLLGVCVRETRTCLAFGNSKLSTRSSTKK